MRTGRLLQNSPVSNSTLNGHYALSFNGYNNGTPFIMAGAFMADGQGNITGGKLDINNGSGEFNDPSQCHGNPNCPIPLVIQSSGSGYDLSAGNGLGTMTIIALDHLGNPTTFQFSIAISALSGCVPSTSYSTCGRLIQRDSNNPQTYGSGVLKAQDSSYFQVTSFFPGNFALLVSGVDPTGGRYTAAGALALNPTTLVDIDCNGNGWGLAGCPLDVDDQGQVGANPMQGTFAAEVDASTGRGNFTNMVFRSDPHGFCPYGSACGYAYYIVNKQEMFLISSNALTKPANLTLWDAVRQSQSAGWSLGALNGAGILQLSALDPNGGKADVFAVRLMSRGNGNASASFDENDGGTLKQQSSPATYSIDSTGQKTGRVVFTEVNGPFSPRWVFYLIASNSAFAVGTDAKASSGHLQPQLGAVFANGSLKGTLCRRHDLPDLFLGDELGNCPDVGWRRPHHGDPIQ